MSTVQQVWNNEEKYAKPAGVQWCWGKADILPLGMDQDINNGIGSISMSESQKQISAEESPELCSLFKKVDVAVANYSIEQDRKEQPPALEESCASDRGSALSQHDMDTSWGTGLLLKETEKFRSRRSLKTLQ
jgi:hypothetical protein